MPKPLKEWTVHPHGPLTQLDEGLFTVVGELQLPLGAFPRRMTVARLRDGRLVIYSAIALDEHAMTTLEEIGEPAFLIVPGDLHRMDAKIWKDRYPQLFVVAPRGAREHVSEVVSVDADHVTFNDPNVRYITVPGTAEREAALLVKRLGGSTLVVNDLIWNVQDRPGFGGWVFHALGLSGGAPVIPFVAKLHSIEDQAALRDQLQAWARLGDLQRIVVSHGDVIETEAPIVLRQLASQLAA
ncbi:MAG TPA: hypothetical protein VIW29_09200 [Polyangiaceae bacterium]